MKFVRKYDRRKESMPTEQPGRKTRDVPAKKAAGGTSAANAHAKRIWIRSACLGFFLLTLILGLGCGASAYGLSAIAASRPTTVEAAPATTPEATPTPFLPFPLPFVHPLPTATLSPTPTASSTSTPAPKEWYDYPIVPEVSDRARAIFAYGLSLGNTPNAFSVIGDCEGIPSLFLGVFDSSPSYYRLGEYAYLQRTIDHFAGYFGRISRAANDSFSTSSILSPLWAHPDYCLSGETPLSCELRINRPSIALVLVGTMDYQQPERFESQMRIILGTLLQNGTVPILYTKASNLEGNWSINATVGRLAYEYDVPLWNFWRAVQPLPGHGLQADGLHLTWAANYFDDPWAMQHGWPWRNLTALQALDAVWHGVDDSPPVDISGPPTIASSG